MAGDRRSNGALVLVLQGAACEPISALLARTGPRLHAPLPLAFAAHPLRPPARM